MTVTPNDKIRLTIQYTTPGNNHAENVRHYRYAGAAPLTDSDVVNDFDVWANAFAEEWKLISTSENQLTSIKINVFQNGQWLPVGSSLIGVNGSGGGPSNPHGNAGLIRMIVQGSIGQSKAFIPGIAENRADDGVMGANGIAELIDMAQLLVLVLDVVFDPAIVGLWIPGVWNTAVSTFAELTGAWFVESVIAYQRRRKQGVGV